MCSTSVGVVGVGTGVEAMARVLKLLRVGFGFGVGVTLSGALGSGARAVVEKAASYWCRYSRHFRTAWSNERFEHFQWMLGV